MHKRRFARSFILYLLAVIIIHVVLFVFLGGVAMGNDISNEERRAMSAIPVFIINDLFGFPLSLFLHYDPLNEPKIGLPLILVFIINCFIQFVILSFIWQKLKTRKIP